MYMDIIKNENLIIYWFYIILNILKNDEINKTEASARCKKKAFVRCEKKAFATSGPGNEKLPKEVWANANNRRPCVTGFLM